jgi:hypothetical protein
MLSMSRLDSTTLQRNQSNEIEKENNFLAIQNNKYKETTRIIQNATTSDNTTESNNNTSNKTHNTTYTKNGREDQHATT